MVARADYPGEARLPASGHSFLQLDGPAILSAYYDEDDGAGGRFTYVRFYECTGRGGEVTLAFDWTPASAEAVDFLDRPLPAPVQIGAAQIAGGSS